MASKASVEAAAKARAMFIELVKAGATLTEASKGVGWFGYNTYSSARQKHPMWGAEVDYALAQAKGNVDKASAAHAPFADFVKLYFPDRRPHLPHQLRLTEEMDRLGPRDVLLFLLWPQAGKTATMEDWICREYARNPASRIRYVSASQDLAKNVIGTIKRRMTDISEYARYIHDFGPFYMPGQEKDGKAWAAEKIMIHRNPGSERDHNLVASSWTSNVLGARIDTLIIDDVCNQKNLDQSEKILNVIQGTFFSREKEMRTVIVGNRIATNDFYDQIIAAGLVTKVIQVPAADPDGNPTVPAAWEVGMTHNGRACCGGTSPFRPCPNNGVTLTPREYMDLMKHQMGDQWWAAYQGNPVANEITTFSEYLERNLDYERLIGQSA